MTREEAIDVLQEKHDECKAFYDLAAHPEEAYPGAKEYMEALQMALAALRGPTREQVGTGGDTKIGKTMSVQEDGSGHRDGES